MDTPDGRQQPTRRREVLQGLAALALSTATPLTACSTLEEKTAWAGDPRSDLIDAHCHLFNGSDLPVVRFLKYVGLHHFPEEATGALDIDDPDLLDGLLALLAAILGVGRAPSAARESAVLDRLAGKDARAENSVANEREVVGAIAAFIDPNAPVAAGIDGSERGRSLVRSAILQAANPGPVAAFDAPMSSAAARSAAAKAYRSRFEIGRYLRWFTLFTRYRHVLAEQLAKDHGRQGFTVRFLAPAMVDYDHWLGQYVDKSPLPDQVEVMGRIAAAKNGPPVHGYVAFDPLRRAIFRPLESDPTFRSVLADPANRALLRAGIFSTPELRALGDEKRFRAARFDPLDLARVALNEHGLLGVKLYPPMGFKPWNNAEKPDQTYPKTVDEALNGAVGAALNQSLTELYSLCLDNDAPILAHAGASVGANRNYERRADPTYWGQLLSDPRWRRLRVCLAHFGGFNVNAAATPDLPMPDGSWEFTFGRIVKADPSLNAYMDVSYMTEIALVGSDQRAKLAKNVMAFLEAFDPDCRRLIFGTDWMMVGREGAYANFTGDMYDFFKDTCGFKPEQLRRLFVDNAARFMGLNQGARTRERILAYYDHHGVPRSKLAAF